MKSKFTTPKEIAAELALRANSLEARWGRNPEAHIMFVAAEFIENMDSEQKVPAKTDADTKTPNTRMKK